MHAVLDPLLTDRMYVCLVVNSLPKQMAIGYRHGPIRYPSDLGFGTCEVGCTSRRTGGQESAGLCNCPEQWRDDD